MNKKSLEISENNLITIKNCRIENSKNVLIPEISWEMKKGESWLFIGTNGGGKSDFINALSGNLKITPNFQSDNLSLYANIFEKSCELVSLEKAATLIQEERENDESEYTPGGIDIGRTGRIFIAESLVGNIKKNQPLPEEAKRLESFPAIKLCGIEKILDRGLKYMSTGEIRRTLLAKALISGKKLLILSDPFAGLDIESRTILLDFINSIQKKQITNVILTMERWNEVPDAITNVLEICDKKISFCGTRKDYENLLKKRNQNLEKTKKTEKEFFSKELTNTLQETQNLQNENSNSEVLIEMNHVNVGWGENKVLVDLNWKLYKNEHWLIRGPNGSGKTTFLELITGDNKQVYANDIHLFGIKRGSGESIWDIKKQLGIVSYRLHVEYRMLGGISLQNVIISGFKDSIGLYEKPTDIEISAAKKWLSLGGFSGREQENFGNLSYGEQRAVLILRSAVKCPQILILDEPCHGLDEKNRERILNLLELIGEQKTSTMLHVTHEQTEVLSCEKHILELCPNETPMYKIISI